MGDRYTTGALAAHEVAGGVDPSAGDASLWRDRDYLLLWSGQVVSTLGGAGSAVAFPLLVLAQTGSATYAGLVSALTTLPYAILSVPAGALVERWDKKRVMILCDLGRALAKASIPLAAALDLLSLGQLFIVAALESVLFAFFSVAERSALPTVVGAARLPAALAHQQTSFYLASLAGPVFGGLLFQWAGNSSPFAFDAATYLLSVFTLASIRRSFQTGTASVQGDFQGGEASGRGGFQGGEASVQGGFQGGEASVRRSLRQEIFEAIRWLLDHPFIHRTCLLNGGLNLMFAANALLLVVLARDLGAGSVMVGFVVAMGALGGLLGSLVGAPLARRHGPARVAVGTTWIVALLVPVYLVAGHPLLLGGAFAAMSTTMPVFSVAVVSFRTRQVPAQLYSRVTGIANRLLSISRPIGAFGAGVLLERAGGSTTVLVLAAYLVGLALWSTLSPHIRAQRTIDRHERAAAGV